MDMDEQMEPAAPASASAAASAAPPAAAFEMPTAPLTPVESSNIESLLRSAPPAPVFEEAAPRAVPVAPPSFSAPSASGRDPMFETSDSDGKENIKIPTRDPALAAREEMTNEEFIAKTP